MSHRHRRDNVAKSVAIGSTIAAIAGFVAGVLAAPKSGDQTRKDIKKAADRGRGQAEREFKKLQKDLSDTVDETKNSTEKLSARAKKELDNLVEKAQDSKEKVREVMSAVHEGDTDNRDLKKAIEDANDAIEHLKSYIKKK
jgi:gas vesicle protein